MLSGGELDRLRSMSRAEANEFYGLWWDEGEEAVRWLGRNDRFFLLVWLLNRQDANRDWIYARCREVEAAPDGYLDLWAREHYKSTVITFAGAIQEILRDPEVTIGIFSFNNKTAGDFVNQIKVELEENEVLKGLYSDVLWERPQNEAQRWSVQSGLVMRRKGNPKEGTINGHGLIEGLPSGPHYDLRIYDDVVTENEVTSPEMMKKALTMWRQSDNLGKEGGRAWHVGTRYHFGDPYGVMLDDKLLTPRLYAGTDNGRPDGKPVLVSEEYLADKRRKLGPYIFSCQWLMNPVADEAQGFKREWIKYYSSVSGEGMNTYILVDPANEKKKKSDYTSMWVIGFAEDFNYYVLDIVRDRLNLTERANKLFDLHRKWKPNGVGYEKYGKDSDIQHIEDRQDRENYRFHIQPLAGNMQKPDRIRRLIPLFESGRVWLPEYFDYWDYEGRRHDLVKVFIEQEYLGFPVAVHEDMLDAMSRMLDKEMSATFPMTAPQKNTGRYEKKPKRRGSWMAA